MLFFAIPAKYATIAFGFMFIAIGVKFLIFAGFFGYGLYSLPTELISAYTLTGLFVILLYKGSLMFFFKQEM